MKNVCLAHDCIKCCLKTQMPLTNSDIRRISGLGFKNFFKVNKTGTRQLRNYNGKCIFQTGKRCTIYNSRPTGCRLYPVVFNEFEDNVILDSHCPFREEFPLTTNVSEKVIELLNELDEDKRK